MTDSADYNVSLCFVSALYRFKVTMSRYSRMTKVASGSEWGGFLSIALSFNLLEALCYLPS